MENFEKGMEKLLELAEVVYDMPEILKPGKSQLVRPMSIAPAAFTTWSRRVFEVVELSRKAALDGEGEAGLDVAWDKWVERAKQLRTRRVRKASARQLTGKSKKKGEVASGGFAGRLRSTRKVSRGSIEARDGQAMEL